MTIEEKESLISKDLDSVSEQLQKASILVSGRRVRDVCFDIVCYFNIGVCVTDVDAVENMQILKAALMDKHRSLIGDIVQELLRKKNSLRFTFSYNDYVLGEINIPIEWATRSDESYKAYAAEAANAVIDLFNSTLSTPLLKGDLLKRDQKAINYLYKWFSSQSLQNKIGNMRMLKENDPSFYRFIISKFEIPTLEELEEGEGGVFE